MSKKEDNTHKDFLTRLLSGQPAGETASSQTLGMGKVTSSGNDPVPHTRHYEGTVRDDGSVSVERAHVHYKDNSPDPTSGSGKSV